MQKTREFYNFLEKEVFKKFNEQLRKIWALLNQVGKIRLAFLNSLNTSRWFKGLSKLMFETGEQNQQTNEKKVMTGGKLKSQILVESLKKKVGR